MILIPSTSSIPYRPFWQAPLVPVKLVYAIFLKALGYLLSFLGFREWGRQLKIKGEQIESRCASLCIGLWAYGKRFLVHGDNSEASCRGSCYWMLNQYFQQQKPLQELAQQFEEGAPKEAIAIHQSGLLPPNLTEELIWQEETAGKWPPMPQLDPGVYTFSIQFFPDPLSPGKAHRFALFNSEKKSLFDPNTGLSEWLASDWTPLLDRIASDIRFSKAGYFILECYSYLPTI
jgi:hypothetical protein